MKGAFFLGNQQVEIRDIPRPEPGRGEVLIQMKGSGICGSDFRVYKGDQESPSVPGHEPCGIIAEVGPDVTEARIGDRVMMHHYSGCGSCDMCRIGYTQMCYEHHEIYGFSMDGGHQEFLLAPAYSCVQMPEALTFEAGAACACGTGTAFFAVKRLDPQPGETVAVFGQGPVGLSATMFAVSVGARVVAVDVSKSRLELAKALGAAETIDASKEDPIKAIQELTGGPGADATLDATGIPDVRIQAVDSVRVWGRVCFVGEGNTTTFDISGQIIHRQLTVYGSWTFSIGGLAEVAQYVVENDIPIDKLITHTYPFEEIEEAYRHFTSGECGKIVINI